MMPRVYATDVPYENKKYVELYKSLYSLQDRLQSSILRHTKIHSNKYTKLTRGMLLCSLSMYTKRLSNYMVQNIKVFKEKSITNNYNDQSNNKSGI